MNYDNSGQSVRSESVIRMDLNDFQANNFKMSFRSIWVRWLLITWNNRLTRIKKGEISFKFLIGILRDFVDRQTKRTTPNSAFKLNQNFSFDVNRSSATPFHTSIFHSSIDCELLWLFSQWRLYLLRVPCVFMDRELQIGKYNDAWTVDFIIKCAKFHNLRPYGYKLQRKKYYGKSL